MFVIFVLAGGFWWGVANLWIKPAVLDAADAKIETVEASAEVWLAKNELAFLQQRLADLRLDPPAFSCAWVDRNFSAGAGLRVRDALRETVSRIEADGQEVIRSGIFIDGAITVMKRMGGDITTVLADAIPEWTSFAPTGGSEMEQAIIRLNLIQTGLFRHQMAQSILDVARTGGTVVAFPGKLRAHMETQFPEDNLSLFNPDYGCFFLDPVCKVKRSPQRSADDLMKDARTAFIDGTYDALVSPIRQVGTTVDEEARNALEELHRVAFEARQKATASIANGFCTWRNVALLASLSSAIILLKTLIIVFSRVIFAPRNAAAQFLPDPPAQDGGIQRHGRVYSIPCASPEAFYVSRWGSRSKGRPRRAAARSAFAFRLPASSRSAGR